MADLLADAESIAYDLSRLGERVHSLRIDRRLSLDSLAERAGVSRSMLAAVEAGSKAPTVLTLHKIATGLGTSMSRLLDDERSDPVIVLSRAQQVTVRDPSGWERRNLIPVLPGSDFEFMRTTLPPSINAGTYPAHAEGAREYVAVESGTLDLTLSGRKFQLASGDSATYLADCEHGFANSSSFPCVYYLAVQNGTGGYQNHAKGKRR